MRQQKMHMAEITFPVLSDEGIIKHCISSLFFLQSLSHLTRLSRVVISFFLIYCMGTVFILLLWLFGAPSCLKERDKDQLHLCVF